MPPEKARQQAAEPKGNDLALDAVSLPTSKAVSCPSVRRLPHLRGFTNIFREEFDVVNIDTLDAKFEANAIVTPESMVEKGMVKKALRVKVLARGEIKKPLEISAHAFSERAKEKITSAGGRVTEIPPGARSRKVR